MHFFKIVITFKIILKIVGYLILVCYLIFSIVINLFKRGLSNDISAYIVSMNTKWFLVLFLSLLLNIYKYL